VTARPKTKTAAPPPPAPSAEIKILADAGAVSQAAAREFSRLARESISAKGEFSVALAGGSTPRAAYQLLAKEGQELPWEKIQVFFGDERAVPPDHADSNYGMARDTLLSHVPIPARNVHRMKGEVEAAAAAEQYEGVVRRHFGLGNGEMPRFDLIMLGMGDDGHTASLFPGSQALEETARLVTANWVEKFQQFRLTFTFPVLNNASEVMFLIAGPTKAKVIGEIFREPAPRGRYPVQNVMPTAGRLLWLLDRAAAQLLGSRT
jgi:6-phosphogluconolactonase